MASRISSSSIAPPMARLFQPERPMYGITAASSGNRSSHSSAVSLVAPHLSPTPLAAGWAWAPSGAPASAGTPRKAKIFGPTLVTTPSPHGSSRHAPGLARQ